MRKIKSDTTKTSLREDQRGAGVLEIILVVVIIAIIAGIGWYVWHVKQTSDKPLDQATSTSQNAGPRFKSDKKTDTKSGGASKGSSAPAAGSSSSTTAQ